MSFPASFLMWCFIDITWIPQYAFNCFSWFELYSVLDRIDSSTNLQFPKCLFLALNIVPVDESMGVMTVSFIFRSVFCLLARSGCQSFCFLLFWGRQHPLDNEFFSACWLILGLVKVRSSGLDWMVFSYLKFPEDFMSYFLVGSYIFFQHGQIFVSLCHF